MGTTNPQVDDGQPRPAESQRSPVGESPADWLKEQAIEWAFRQDDMKTETGRTKAYWICAAFKTAAERAEREGWTRTR
jgi:hypothetical protein